MRNEDWDDEKKGWDKVRWNNRAMAMAMVTINKKEEEIEELKEYIRSKGLHLPDCWVERTPNFPCTCDLEVKNGSGVS